MSHILPCADGTMLTQEEGAYSFSRYDVHFHKIWNRPVDLLPNAHQRYDLTVSPDEEMIGLQGKNGVRIYDRWGGLLYAMNFEPTHNVPTAEVYFSRRDLMGERFVWFLEPAPDRGGLLHVLNAVDFSTADRVALDDVDYYWTFYATPDNDTVFINLSAGQYGGRLLKAKLIHGKIAIEELDQRDDWVMGSFSPKSTEFVVAPHYDEPIRIYSFPRIQLLAGISQASLVQGDDQVNYWVEYVSETTLLVWTQLGRLLLVDREKGETIGELIAADNDFSLITLTPKGDLWIRGDSNTIRVYELPHIAH